MFWQVLERPQDKLCGEPGALKHGTFQFDGCKHCPFSRSSRMNRSTSLCQVLERPQDKHYYFNSCRTPWRLALYYSCAFFLPPVTLPCPCLYCPACACHQSVLRDRSNACLSCDIFLYPLLQGDARPAGAAHPASAHDFLRGGGPGTRGVCAGRQARGQVVPPQLHRTRVLPLQGAAVNKPPKKRTCRNREAVSAAQAWSSGASSASARPCAASLKCSDETNSRITEESITTARAWPCGATHCTRVTPLQSATARNRHAKEATVSDVDVTRNLMLCQVVSRATSASPRPCAASTGCGNGRRFRHKHTIAAQACDPMRGGVNPAHR